MKENGFEYVDLGLPSKTMWATCNVGATKPEDEGLLFQFGRVNGYKYGDKNHKFRPHEQNIKDTGNEEMPATSSGKIYKANEILDLVDDAAHVNMGGKWRMPTKDDFEELYDLTIHEVETINGVQGMLFTSKMNRNKLFVPFANWYDEYFYGVGTCVHVGYSQVIPSYEDSAYRLLCSSYVDVCIDYCFCSCAFSVRRVFKIYNIMKIEFFQDFSILYM